MKAIKTLGLAFYIIYLAQDTNRQPFSISINPDILQAVDNAPLFSNVGLKKKEDTPMVCKN